jgi:hypothetical protein
MDLEHVANDALTNTTSLLHAVGSSSGVLHSDQPPPTSEEIAQRYDNAFAGLCKSLYLLTQWKESWDSALAAAVAQEASSMGHHHNMLPHFVDLNMPPYHHHLQPHDVLGGGLHHQPLLQQQQQQQHLGQQHLGDPTGLAEAVAAAVAAVNGDPRGGGNQSADNNDGGDGVIEL